MQKITPFLWYNNNLEEAVNFYLSIFKNSKTGSMSRGGDGSVFSGTFTLDGQEFFALNGGPMYSFTPAVSFFVNCETQAEVDDLWTKLTAGGGSPGRCGWLKDKFGLSWQVVPSVLNTLLRQSDGKKSAAVMQAMMQMNKLEIAELQRASDQA
jgi:predicted 3-demethylubiquinone-9 3-methyltransferase (glyoxalase superfamily)